MPYFVVQALDHPGKGHVRAANRAAHRARLRAPDQPLTVHIGGPLLDDTGEMIGTMLVVEASVRRDVEDFIAGDPYAQAGLYVSVEIRPYLWGLGQPDEVLHG